MTPSKKTANKVKWRTFNSWSRLLTLVIVQLSRQESLNCFDRARYRRRKVADDINRQLEGLENRSCPVSPDVL